MKYDFQKFKLLKLKGQTVLAGSAKGDLKLTNYFKH